MSFRFLILFYLINYINGIFVTITNYMDYCFIYKLSNNETININYVVSGMYNNKVRMDIWEGPEKSK